MKVFLVSPLWVRFILPNHNVLCAMLWTSFHAFPPSTLQAFQLKCKKIKLPKLSEVSKLNNESKL